MTLNARIGSVAVVLAFACAPALGVQASSARAGALYLHSCSKLNDGGAAWAGVGNGSFAEANRCAQGGSFQIDAPGYPIFGDNGQWHTITPPSIGIVAAYTPPNDVLINPQIGTDGYSATFFWGATQPITPTGNCCGGMDYGGGINRTDIGGSHYFGFQVTCVAIGGCYPQAPSQLLDVNGIELEGIDNTPPTTSAPGPTNLWYEANRWVRGAWPATFQAGDDSGICGSALGVDGQVIAGSSDPTPNQGSWTQCPTPVTINKLVDTANYPDGPLALAFSAWDAANPVNVSSPAETVYVDNQPVSLSLSGPTDATTAAGTQYITATAAAGPSGVGIACSVDGAPSDWNAGPTAQIAVQGLGAHQVSCYAQNGATNAGGQPATSPVQTWSLSIRQPSVSALSFDRVVGGLRCARARQRVTVPAQWVTVHAHGGRRLRVKLPAQSHTISVVRCHPRFVVRRVVIGGRRRTERTVVPPRRLRAMTKRVPFGARTSVAGWLGTSDGTALGDQPVQILTAPDNGHNGFTPAATTTTAADGSWSAPLPAGPSRIVTAVYNGSATVEPSDSLPARVIVPASIRIRTRPQRTHWGGTITISGRLRGGYIPPAGEVVVLWIGWRGGSTEIGHLYAGGDGRFRSPYTFLRGNGTETYRLWAATATESDYPYAARRSRKVRVVVGP